MTGVLAKLGVTLRTKAALLAVREGLVRLNERGALAALVEEGGDGGHAAQVTERAGGTEGRVPERVASRDTGHAHVGVRLVDEAVAR